MSQTTDVQGGELLDLESKEKTPHQLFRNSFSQGIPFRKLGSDSSLGYYKGSSHQPPLKVSYLSLFMY